MNPCVATLALAGSLAAVLSAPAALAQSSEAATREQALEQKVDALARQLLEVQAELARLRAERSTVAESTAPAAAPAAPEAATEVAHAGVASTADSEAGELSVFGYGEVNYNHYDNSAQTQADLRRAVLGLGYRFDAKTHFVSEFEVEHAIASADDAGEFEVEQFYVDHMLSDAVSTKFGLFLIPSGLLNLSHEPTRYYGVERNFVETAIIPTTWREGGVSLYGRTEGGLSWDLGLTTGFSIGNWDYTSTDGRESPLGAIHQELQLAGASDLAQYLAVNWQGLPGLTVGGSVFTGKTDQGQPGLSSDPRVTLGEAHLRYTRGPLDVSALYAQGHISDTQDLNLINLGQLTPIPEDFYGWYLQGAYRVWKRGSYALHPFVRYERFNTASDYASLPAGYDDSALPLETVQTIGANFYLNPNVVLKIDYQDFLWNDDADRLDLGMGLMFY